MGITWQGGLFDDEPAEDLSFAAVRRIPLDERSWLDVVPGWLPDHADVFQDLLEHAPWRQRERKMYDRTVLEPRLVAAWPSGTLEGLPPRLRRIRDVVSARYGVPFDSVLVNLYRDGQDAVAWHGDTVRKRLPRTVVVTVGLGERRRFWLRPGTTGPATLRLTSGEGDLVVMGGRAQHDWQHTVPRTTGAGARMSITMRHSAPLLS